jgi:hypothetical protein
LLTGILFLIIFIISAFRHDPLINPTIANISAFLSLFLFVIFFSSYIIFLVNRKNKAFRPLKNRDMQTGPFEISIESYVNLKDYILTQIEMSLGGRMLLFLMISFFTLLVCFASLAGTEKGSVNHDIAALIVIICFIALVVTHIIHYRNNINRDYIRGRFGIRSVLMITDMFVKIIGKEIFNTTMAWSQFDKVVETKKYIQLYYDKTDALWIDKRWLNPMQLHVFRVFLSSIVIDRYSFEKK